MSRYSIDFSVKAAKDFDKFRKSNPHLLRKVEKILKDIKMHPRTGLGHPEALVGEGGDVYSRHVSGKNRIVYEICEEEMWVSIISLEGHYKDK
ncbi:MAG: Txe/YoeB family addiction module toxin [Prevotellaceae bacterium]|nr:Txe/YoeB family addiction module toxin [Prevotellaceae bacterium]